ncbi:MAG: HlyC/CorC family transporter [Deltaproteobacteria bacterium]|nr:HlyC/CorC family transporter [Deltaproteobacteria bacterium]
MVVLIFFFFLVLSVSFLCSLLEATFLSITHSHVALMEKRGLRSGQIMQKLKSEIDRPLAAILTLNTVAHTIGSAGVGAQALSLFGSKWVALASGILTLSILILSEIIPKTLGAVYWRELAPSTAYLIRGLIFITYPLVIVFEAISSLLRSGARLSKVTREELIAAAEISEDEGELLRREQQVIKNLLRLNRMYARDILTPRSVMFALLKSSTVGEVIEENTPLRFSRIPIYGESLDDIEGMVYRLELLERYFHGQTDKKLESITHPLKIVPDSKSVAEIMDDFIKQREHLFLVVDEYGGTAGIITLEDTIETLLGVEIVDESDSVEDMREYARQRWEHLKDDDEFHD